MRKGLWTTSTWHSVRNQIASSVPPMGRLAIKTVQESSTSFSVMGPCQTHLIVTTWKNRAAKRYTCCKTLVGPASSNNFPCVTRLKPWPLTVFLDAPQGTLVHEEIKIFRSARIHHPRHWHPTNSTPVTYFLYYSKYSRIVQLGAVAPTQSCQQRHGQLVYLIKVENLWTDLLEKNTQIHNKTASLNGI